MSLTVHVELTTMAPQANSTVEASPAPTLEVQ
jgi:hypothetical protein